MRRPFNYRVRQSRRRPAHRLLLVLLGRSVSRGRPRPCWHTFINSIFAQGLVSSNGLDHWWFLELSGVIRFHILCAGHMYASRTMDEHLPTY